MKTALIIIAVLAVLNGLLAWAITKYNKED